GAGADLEAGLGSFQRALRRNYGLLARLDFADARLQGAEAVAGLAQDRTAVLLVLEGARIAGIDRLLHAGLGGKAREDRHHQADAGVPVVAISVIHDAGSASAAPAIGPAPARRGGK